MLCFVRKQKGKMRHHAARAFFLHRGTVCDEGVVPCDAGVDAVDFAVDALEKLPHARKNGRLRRCPELASDRAEILAEKRPQQLRIRFQTAVIHRRTAAGKDPLQRHICSIGSLPVFLLQCGNAGDPLPVGTVEAGAEPVTEIRRQRLLTERASVPGLCSIRLVPMPNPFRISDRSKKRLKLRITAAVQRRIQRRILRQSVQRVDIRKDRYLRKQPDRIPEGCTVHPVQIRTLEPVRTGKAQRLRKSSAAVSAAHGKRIARTKRLRFLPYRLFVFRTGGVRRGFHRCRFSADAAQLRLGKQTLPAGFGDLRGDLRILPADRNDPVQMRMLPDILLHIAGIKDTDDRSAVRLGKLQAAAAEASGGCRFSGAVSAAEEIDLSRHKLRFVKHRLRQCDTRDGNRKCG